MSATQVYSWSLEVCDNYVYADDLTPLMLASWNGNTYTVVSRMVASTSDGCDAKGELLDAGAAVNAQSRDSESPLHIAAWWAHTCVT